jgi:membrane fusion protein, multidrug efflux system
MGAMVDTARSNADAAQRQVAQARARVAMAQAQQAATKSAPQEIENQRARASSSQANAQAELTNVQQAQLNQQYTIITSPIDGVIGRRSVEVGQQIQAGQDLMSVVPLSNLWITANYKETQLQHMRVGQPVTIHVDALDRDYKGHVESFPGATGARFSLLPPENATGNYVKVVQRLPVRIFFDAGQDTEHTVRPGMSVETKVWVNK